MSIEQTSFSSRHVSAPSSPLLDTVFDNDDTTASLVYITHDPLDDLLCEPFIGTPEPSFSPAAFEANYNDNISYEPFSPNMSYEPSMLNNYDNDKNQMSYETSSPVYLLPFLVSPPEQDAQNSVQAFELIFTDNDAYEQFMNEYQPQVEVEMPSVYERSDRTMDFEQL